jgi:hypothetical protein
MRCKNVGWEKVQVGLERHKTFIFGFWDLITMAERKEGTPEGGRGIGIKDGDHCGQTVSHHDFRTSIDGFALSSSPPCIGEEFKTCRLGESYDSASVSRRCSNG